MRQITILIVLAVVVFAAPLQAQAQVGRVLGAAVSVAGAVMLLVDPEQPTQPASVSRDMLIDEVADFITGPCGTNPVSCEFREIVLSIEPRLLVIERRGVLVGAIAGAGVGIAAATSDGRTVYTGSIVPYEERSSGLKYGGAAMVIGGAVLAALWPTQPAVENLSITPTVGGVQARKSFGW